MKEIKPDLIKMSDGQANFCVAIAEARDELEISLPALLASELAQCDVRHTDHGLAFTFHDTAFRVATAECLNAVYRLWPQIRPSPLFIAVGHTVTSVGDISFSYETASYLLRYRFVYYEDTIINLDSLNVVTGSIEWTDEMIVDMILANNRVGLRRACRDLNQRFRSKPASESDIKVGVSQQFMRLVRSLEQLTAYRLPEREIDRWTKQIRTAISLEQLCSLLVECYYEMSEILNISQDLPPAERVLTVLRQDYAEEITLDSIATQLNYNAAYLGRLVKQAYDLSFNALRDQVRIDEAKRLLGETSLSVGEISSRVGFKDKDYFSSKFKRMSGITPTQYRQKYGFSSRH